MRTTLVFVIFVCCLLLVALTLEQQLLRTTPRFEVAFSAPQARYLGLEAAETYRAILRDLKPVHVRLQANWNELEPKSGTYDFRELDKLIEESAAAKATVTLAIGRKLPRWPECHDPAWLSALKPWEVESQLSAMLTQVVGHYRGNTTITRWQLENEPLFSFGDCPAPSLGLLKRERDLVHSLDKSRPILITDSGELSPWLETAMLADEQGSTLYRVTYDPILGYFTYPWPSLFYRLKAALVSPFVKRTVVSELQLEPWAAKGLLNLPADEVQRSFSLDQFYKNVKVARATGFPEVFTWGVEWWYWQAQHGNPRYWQAAQELFKAQALVGTN